MRHRRSLRRKRTTGTRRFLFVRWHRSPDRPDWQLLCAWPLTKRLWWDSTTGRVHSSIPLTPTLGRRPHRLGSVLLRWFFAHAWWISTLVVATVRGWWPAMQFPPLHPDRSDWWVSLLGPDWWTDLLGVTAQVDRAAVHRAGLITAAAAGGWLLIWLSPATITLIRWVTGADLWTVQEVVDGDTIHCGRGNRTIEVRLLGVDAWELDDPGGAEAADYTHLLEGCTVRLIDRRPGADKYGRDLTYVSYRGTDWGEGLIAEGHARAADYGRQHPRRDRYRRAQRDAMRDRIGVWADATAVDETGKPAFPLDALAGDR